MKIEKVLEEHFEVKKIGNDYGINYDEYPWSIKQHPLCRFKKII